MFNRRPNTQRIADLLPRFELSFDGLDAVFGGAVDADGNEIADGTDTGYDPYAGADEAVAAEQQRVEAQPQPEPDYAAPTPNVDVAVPAPEFGPDPYQAPQIDTTGVGPTEELGAAERDATLASGAGWGGEPGTAGVPVEPVAQSPSLLGQLYGGAEHLGNQVAGAATGLWNSLPSAGDMWNALPTGSQVLNGAGEVLSALNPFSVGTAHAGELPRASGLPALADGHTRVEVSPGIFQDTAADGSLAGLHTTTGALTEPHKLGPTPTAPNVLEPGSSPIPGVVVAEPGKSIFAYGQESSSILNGLSRTVVAPAVAALTDGKWQWPANAAAPYIATAGIVSGTIDKVMNHDAAPVPAFVEASRIGMTAVGTASVTSNLVGTVVDATKGLTGYGATSWAGNLAKGVGAAGVGYLTVQGAKYTDVGQGMLKAADDMGIVMPPLLSPLSPAFGPAVIGGSALYNQGRLLGAAVDGSLYQTLAPNHYYGGSAPGPNLALTPEGDAFMRSMRPSPLLTPLR